MGSGAECLDLNKYWNKIDQLLNTNKYNNLFVATDSSLILDLCYKRYGNKIKINENVTRSSNQDPVHNGLRSEKEKLIFDVMKDALSLTYCDLMLATSSNVTGFTLMINPQLETIFIDKPDV